MCLRGEGEQNETYSRTHAGLTAKLLQSPAARSYKTAYRRTKLVLTHVANACAAGVNKMKLTVADLTASKTFTVASRYQFTRAD